MANFKKVVSENIPGNQFVDSSCINCDACRKFAPQVFADSGKTSYVKKNIEGEDEWLAFQRALLSCPVKAIGDLDRKPVAAARKTLPLKLLDGVYLNGFNDRSTFGADSYFLISDSGNWMVDSPSYNGHLVKQLERLGGIEYIYLSHRDDIADCCKYAKKFNAKIIIHQNDADVIPEADIILTGQDEHSIGEHDRIIPVPGHTKGHLLLLWKNNYLFTGDHFAWSDRLQSFTAFKDYCWYNWEEQKKSLAKMVSLKDVTHVFPGHGRRGTIVHGKFPTVVREYLKSL